MHPACAKGGKTNAPKFLSRKSKRFICASEAVEMRPCEITWQLTYHVHVILKKPSYQTVKSPLTPVAERGRRVCSFLAIHYYVQGKETYVNIQRHQRTKTRAPA